MGFTKNELLVLSLVKVACLDVESVLLMLELDFGRRKENRQVTWP